MPLGPPAQASVCGRSRRSSRRQWPLLRCQASFAQAETVALRARECAAQQNRTATFIRGPVRLDYAKLIASGQCSAFTDQGYHTPTVDGVEPRCSASRLDIPHL